MRLLTCGHCGRPIYDNEKACPYCGHAFLPSQETGGMELETKDEQVQETESHAAVTIDSQPVTANPPVNSRSESIAAITTANSNIAAEEFNPECDPNQIETTYPPRRRRLWLWIVLLLLLAALASAAYIFITNGSITLGAIGIK